MIISYLFTYSQQCIVSNIVFMLNTFCFNGFTCLSRHMGRITKVNRCLIMGSQKVGVQTLNKRVSKHESIALEY